MKKFGTALFIGRFQPFHNGHLYSLKKCLELAEHVIVGIGSSEESGTDKNPWNYETRKKMIETVAGRSISVVAIPDDPSDEVWLQNLIRIVGTFDIVVSNNDWVLSILRGAGYTALETGLFNREELEGVKIRALMRAGDAGWKSRVPDGLIGLIDQPRDNR